MPAIDAGPPPLYQNDFSTGLTGLTVGDGTWTGGSGVVQQTDSCNAATDLVVASGDWSDFRARVNVRFDVTCASWGLRQVALLARVTSVAGCNNRYLGCLLDLDNGFLMIAEWNNQCVTYDNVYDYIYTLAADVWYTIAIEVVGNVLSCQITGPGLTYGTTLSRVDYSSFITSGSVGLATWEAAVSCDDLVVESP